MRGPRVGSGSKRGLKRGSLRKTQRFINYKRPFFLIFSAFFFQFLFFVFFRARSSCFSLALMNGARRPPSWAAVSGEPPAKQRPLDNRSETPFFRSVVLLAKILFFLHESEKQDSENIFFLFLCFCFCFCFGFLLRFRFLFLVAESPLGALLRENRGFFWVVFRRSV